MSGERSADDLSEDIAIETASPDDRLDILRVLDAAMLETDTEVVDTAIDASEALVARFKRTNAVVGALVAMRPEPGGLHIDAVAVRRARRGRGIGSALVAEAVRRAERDAKVAVVTAEFDPKLKGFYTDLGFAVDSERDEVETDRLRGRYPADGGSVDAEGTGERRR
ncbi:GNAT family N-acetyltransferase [Halorubrum lacusprofundi]|uniref:GNAT family N-acetyltransferase n=1 Tax=Halorubrum lacusprofundi TaxID=2247 RepID=UPI000B5A6DDE|nr:GNAT family N-acetyltransferase [Halorubrum lacusprofundi]MCG1005653.1 GNAT family N-acetyltransferase [Halorubrum lacusprofundi]